MANCGTSPDLDKVAGGHAGALEAIAKLEQSVKDMDDQNVAEFEAKCKEALAKAGIRDAQQTEFTSHVKTEFTSEFSIDKIAAVVKSTLKAVAAAKGGDGFSADAVEAYTDVVNVVAEAAKSKSAGASTLAFQFQRLTPGTFVFLFAKSSTISDSKLFGDQTVSCTVIYHKVIESIEDVQKGGEFGGTIADAAAYLHIKHLQKLNDQWMDDNMMKHTPEIDNLIDAFGKTDDKLEVRADKIMLRLMKHGFDRLDDLKKKARKLAESED